MVRFKAERGIKGLRETKGNIAGERLEDGDGGEDPVQVF